MVVDLSKCKSKSDMIRSAVEGGYSYASIGRVLGLSRERVRQIVDKEGFKFPVPDGYITIAEAAGILSYSPPHILRFIRLGCLPAIKPGGRWFVKPELNRGPCKICGNPIGYQRTHYCGQACYEVAANQSRKRSGWRRFHRKYGTGQNVYPL